VLVNGARPRLPTPDDPQPSFSVEIRHEHQAAIVVPRGELDLATAPSLEAELERAWQSDPPLVIIDLRALQFMDLRGLRILITARQRARESGRKFGLVDGDEQVHTLPSLTGVLDTLDVFPAPDDVQRS
jgi:anti-anti-sigma factor